MALYLRHFYHSMHYLFEPKGISGSGSWVILFRKSLRIISIDQNQTKCPKISETFSYHGRSNRGGVSPMRGNEIIWTKSWAKAPASKPCQSLILEILQRPHNNRQQTLSKDNVRNTNPVKDMPGKGINSRIGICQPQPVSKKNIRWIEKITRAINLACSPD